MHALLITGGTQATRQEKLDQYLVKWNIAAHDRVILTSEEGSVGIAKVREFQKQLQLQPLGSEATMGIIPVMDLLTPEAQNALLKTLEEPPPHARIIGLAQTNTTLLPTVLSRMQHIALRAGVVSKEAREDAYALFDELTTLSVGAKLARIEPLTPTKEQAAAWIETTIAAWETKLHGEQHTATTAVLARAIRLLLTARAQLAANVNHRLAIDTAILEL